MRANRFILFLVGGTILMVILFFGFGRQRFEKYSSRDPELNVTMDYFRDWNFYEDRGAYDSYAQAIFLEPVRKEKPLRASVVLNIIKESKANFQPLTLTGFFDNQIKKWSSRKEVKFLSREKSKIADLPAYSIELTYYELANPEVLPANFVLMRERVFLWQKDRQFYTLRYVNIAKEFGKLENGFIHCVDSVRFKTVK
jgi:hypothetical protein